jgi:hypothetical protein
MIADDSNLFLIMFWLGLQREHSVIVFHNISFRSQGHKKAAFDNFGLFLFDIFTEIDFLNSRDSSNHKLNHNLIMILEVFWHNRLGPLAKKSLDSPDFISLNGKIKEKFRFLKAFLDGVFEYLVAQEYDNLILDLKNGCMNLIFRFLARHFAHTLRATELDQVLEKIEWMERQTPIFLLYFVYCYKLGISPLPYQISILRERAFSLVQCAVEWQIEIKQGSLFVFEKLICESETDPKLESFHQKTKILNLANSIIQKISLKK